MPRGQKQRDYEERQQNARAAVPEPVVPTVAEFRDYVGEEIFKRIGLTCADDDPVDSMYLRERYSSDGGLVRFLTECFPNSTSMKPFGPYQLESVRILESVIRSGGTEQCLEPRAYAKTARMTRGALWSAIFGLRRCTICFQSSASKARNGLDTIKNELVGSLAIRAIFPELSMCCRHISVNTRLDQTFSNELTEIDWKVDSIRLPDVYAEDGTAMPFNGARVLVMPFGSATGTTKIDPTTLEDLRPDLLLCDDVQDPESARNSSRDTDNLLSLYHNSICYLGGRGKTIATLFSQTIFGVEDMADRLSKDPSVHTVKYGALIKPPDNHEWWMTVYKEALLDYLPDDPHGQANARRAATKLYLENREYADAGSEVAWEHAYDPQHCGSALQAIYNNRIRDEEAFWCQDQNSPRSSISVNDIRCKPMAIMKKQHKEKRSEVPDFSFKLVCHIDVQDTLLFWMVAGGSASMSLGIVDSQTWPPNGDSDFKLDVATNTFLTVGEYAELPSTSDRVRAALNDLLAYLMQREWTNESGEQFQLDRIGIDCSDGDHWDAVHAFCRDNKHFANVYPVKGMAAKRGQVPLMERAVKKDRKEYRGDHWSEKVSPTTRVRWVEYDASYYKRRLHNGFNAPLGTSLSVSVWNEDRYTIHEMLANHCNNEVPQWSLTTRANETTSGTWEWVLKPNAENHKFDNAVGCHFLLNFAGGKFDDAQKKPLGKVRQRLSVADALARHGIS